MRPSAWRCPARFSSGGAAEPPHRVIRLATVKATAAAMPPMSAVWSALRTGGEMLSLGQDPVLVRHVLVLTFGPQWEKDIARIARGF